MRTLILMTLIAMELAQAGLAQSSAEIRRAIERALPLLQKSGEAFVEKRACFSCHHNALPILTLHHAMDKGFVIDKSVLANIEEKTFRPLRGDRALDDAIQATALNDPTPNDSLLLMAAQAAGLERDLPLEIYARRIARWQRDGHWITSDFRPPHSSSLFTATATAVRAISAYMPAELAKERDGRLRDAVQWLAKTKPASTEDASFRLMGLAWANAPWKIRRSAAADLTALQQKDGGWVQLPGYPSDAYSTGEALYALSLAGLGPIWSSGSPAMAEEFGISPGGLVIPDPFNKGLGFLISTQSADGTWHVPSRMTSPAEVSPPYFETGFPYGHDQFVSYAGTNWALMALLASALSDDSKAAGVNRSQAPAKVLDSIPYVRTVLFGDAGQLNRLLDAGLDPNQQTIGGTTLLMMAAADPDKVKLLLAKGANVKARARSNVDALTVAASYYGNVKSIAALLGAGAEVDAPDRSKPTHSPLLLATMTGDTDGVKLLLAHGAEAAEGYPLGEAITFNHPDVARALIAAGSSTTEVETTGINLIHWATITNRPGLIPVLAKAGVPLNDVDDNGYTALMYAAEIDFGDTGVLDALLKAGADRSVRDFEGKMAVDHARSKNHPALAKALAAKNAGSR